MKESSVKPLTFFGNPINIHKESEEEKAKTEKMVNDFSEKAPIFTNEINFDPEQIEYAIYYLDRIKDLKFNDDEANNSEHIKLFFKDDYDFEIAGLLLIDGLLPIQAREAYVQCVFNAQVFLSDKNIVCEALFILPNKRGRKSIKNEIKQRIGDVQEALNNGLSITESYKLVASKYNKSVETIRRDFERHKNENKPVKVELRQCETYTEKSNGEVEVRTTIFPKEPHGEVEVRTTTYPKEPNGE